MKIKTKKNIRLKHLNLKDTLRFITCGSVDDGKSTLIGRLLYDSKLILEDQLTSLQVDTKKFSNLKENFDFALLVDGLQAEREQGITIDVAYRFFSTNKRRFIVADTPGHTQYTKNMVTGSSTADLAILLIDARKGLLEQTKRHSFITTLFGIKNLIIAINKMDLIEYEEKVFNNIKTDYLSFIKNIEDHTNLNIKFVPISALKGDNIVNISKNMLWYRGKSLLQILENIQILKIKKYHDFILGVKYVSHTNSNYRSYKGKINFGEIKVGDKVQIYGKNIFTTIKSINKNLNVASKGDLVSLELNDDIDISYGDYITSPVSLLSKSFSFVADIIWMDKDAMDITKEYIIKFYNNNANTKSIKLNYIYDIERLNKKYNHNNTLLLNQIANVNIEIDSNIPITLYTLNKELGSFILIDKFSNATVVAGIIKGFLNSKEEFATKTTNIKIENSHITFLERAEIKNQKPFCLWLTGLSGSGKSTIARLLDKNLYYMNKHTFILDGDNIRHGINSDLGFSVEDRYENIRRIGHISKLMYDAGLIVISAFISPDHKIRNFIKNNIFNNKDFFEIYIKTNLEECIKRDPKGLYKKAKNGEIKNFTGIDANYNIPNNPDLIVDTQNKTPEKSVQIILDFLKEKDCI